MQRHFSTEFDSSPQGNLAELLEVASALEGVALAEHEQFQPLTCSHQPQASADSNQHDIVLGYESLRGETSSKCKL